MKPTLLSISLLICLTYRAFGQQDSVVIPDPERYNFSSLFYTGFPTSFVTNNAVTRYANLYKLLKAEDIKPNDITFMPIGYALRIRRSKIEFGFTFLSGGSASGRLKNKPKTYETKAAMNVFSMGYGYAVHNSRNNLVFLNIDIGRIDYELEITRLKPSATTTTIGGLIQSPQGTSSILTHSNTFAELSAEWMHRPKKDLSFNPNFKIGYRFGLNQTPWSVAGQQVSEQLYDRVSQFFVTTSFIVGKNHIRTKKTPKQP